MMILFLCVLVYGISTFFKLFYFRTSLLYHPQKSHDVYQFLIDTALKFG